MPLAWMLALGSMGFADPTVTILPRKVADFGFTFSDPSCAGMAFDTAETDIALANGVVVAVSFGLSPQVDFRSETIIPCTSDGKRVRAAVRSAAGSWAAAYIQPFELQGVGLDDPSVAHNPVTGQFVVVARKLNSLWQSTYTPGLDAFSSWSMIAGVTNDKPWLLSGKGQELYLVYNTSTNPPASDGIGYLRSPDGGLTWSTPRTVSAGGSAVQAGGYCTVPAVSGDGPLYVAYKASAPNAYRFLRGDDDLANNDVSFSHLVSATGLLEVDIQSWASIGSSYPAPSCTENTLINGRLTPAMAVDPSAAASMERLYFVYHDIRSGDTDLNVYLRRLERPATQAEWTVTPAIKISDEVDSAGRFSDQFMPTVAVDGLGRVHVLFYDNREVCGSSPESPRYRWYYALSTDQGQTFKNYPVDDCRVAPSLDYMDPTICTGAPLPPSPKEYNGIALDESDPEKTVVWTSYYGVSPADPGDIRTVIYSARIEVSVP